MKRTSRKNDVFNLIESQVIREGRLLAKQLKEFTLKETITFEELTPCFLEDFRLFLSLRFTNSYSRIFVYLKTLRTVCRIAVESGISDANPFDAFTIPAYQKPKPYYSAHQLQKLGEVSHSVKPLICQAFYFILFTGIRIKGLRQLTIVQAKNMTLGTDAKQLLQTIINGRINQDEPLFKALPDHAKLSCTLRLWGALAGLEQRPTLNCARNTFILNQLKKSKDIRKTLKKLGLRAYDYMPLINALSDGKPSNTSV